MPKASLTHKRHEFDFYDKISKSPLLYKGRKLKNNSHYFFKSHPGHSINNSNLSNLDEFESASSEIWRWMLGERAAKNRCLYSSKREILGVISKAIPDFESIDLLWKKTIYKYLKHQASNPSTPNTFWDICHSFTDLLTYVNDLIWTRESPVLPLLRVALTNFQKNSDKSSNENFNYYFRRFLKDHSYTTYDLENDDFLQNYLKELCDFIDSHHGDNKLNYASALYSILNDSKSQNSDRELYELISEYMEILHTESLVKYDIASVLVSAYLLEETDMHSGNWGFSEKLHAFTKIDHDCSLMEVTQQFHRLRAKIYSDCNYEITRCDIESFPNLTQGNLFHWPTQGHTLSQNDQKQYGCDAQHKRYPEISTLSTDSRFINQKYLAMTKFLLLPDSLIYRAASLHLNSERSRTLFVRTILSRRRTLLAVLQTTPSYHDFLEKYFEAVTNTLQGSINAFYNSHKHFRDIHDPDTVRKKLSTIKLQLASAMNPIETAMPPSEAYSDDDPPFAWLTF